MTDEERDEAQAIRIRQLRAVAATFSDEEWDEKFDEMVKGIIATKVEEGCSTCRFCRGFSTCHRRAPVVSEKWPSCNTDGCGWCGEWEGKK